MPASSPVDLTVTPAAVVAVQRFLADAPAITPSGGVRVTVQPGGCVGLRYAVAIEAHAGPEDTVVEVAGIRIFVDPFSHPYLQGVILDYITALRGSGFTFRQPPAVVDCHCRSGAI